MNSTINNICGLSQVCSTKSYQKFINNLFLIHFFKPNFDQVQVSKTTKTKSFHYKNNRIALQILSKLYYKHYIPVITLQSSDLYQKTAKFY